MSDTHIRNGNPIIVFRLVTFGGLSLLRGGEPLSGALSQRSRLALLAILAVAGPKGISRDKLVVLLWPDSDLEHARRALNQNLYSTRRELASEDVILGSADLRLNSSLVSSDVAEFEAAVAAEDWSHAVALYGGPFLDGIYIRGSSEFERWSSTQGTRYQADYTRAVEALAQRAESHGDHSAAANWWKRLATLDLLSARYTAATMRALARAGDYGVALSQYRAHEAALQEELERSPDESVQAVLREIEERTRPNGGAKMELANAPPPAVPADYVPPADSPAPGLDEARERPATLRFPRGTRMIAAAVAVLVIAASAVIAGSVRQPDNPRVLVVAFDNLTGDPSLDLLGNLIADWSVARLGESGLAEAVIAPLKAGGVAAVEYGLRSHEHALATARANRIGLAVAGSFSRTADTVVIQPVILDVETGSVVRYVPPVSAADDDFDSIADKTYQTVAGSLAALLDRRLTVLRSQLDRPPRYDAYTTYMTGLERFQAMDAASAYEAFARARSTDSTFILPLIWQYWVAPPRDSVLRDSLVQALSRQRERLTPLERASLEYIEALERWEPREMLAAARRGAVLAPGSNWHHNLGLSLLDANRPADAVRAFASVNAQAWVGSWAAYWAAYINAAHLAGDDALALRLVAAAKEADAVPGPRGSRFMNPAEARVRAARGDRRAIMALLDRVSGYSDPQHAELVLRTVVHESHWHGHYQLRDEMRARLVEWARARYDTTTVDGLETLMRAYALAEMNRELWETALRLRNAGPPAAPHTGIGTVGWLGIAAGRLGMHSIAAAYADTLNSMGASSNRVRAQAVFWRGLVATARGDKREAVALFRNAVDKGDFQVYRHLTVFGGLEDYEPFRGFIRPRNDSWQGRILGRLAPGR